MQTKHKKLRTYYNIYNGTLYSTNTFKILRKPNDSLSESFMILKTCEYEIHFVFSCYKCNRLCTYVFGTILKWYLLSVKTESTYTSNVKSSKIVNSVS